MKKFFLLIFVFLFTIVPCSFVASADETVFVEGHYEYTVSNDEATIVYVRQSLVGDITVPTTLGGYPVVALGEHAFTGFDTITSITIGGELRTIGPSAFTNCDKLETVILGDSVITIESYAFIDCVNLKSVNIPKNLQTIGNEVFFGCVSLNDISVSVENPYFSSVDGVLFDKNQTKLIRYFEGMTNPIYTIPDTVETIGWEAFHGCEYLTSVIIPDSVQTIEYGAFSWCHNLELVTIPDSVISLGDSAFYDCHNLIHVNLGNGIKNIGAEVFYGCGFSDIIIPETVEWIGVCAFMHCTNLVNLTIPENVESIGQGAFMFCWELKTVELPKSLIKIRERAFAECRNITNVYYAGTQQDKESIYIAKDNLQLETAVWHCGTKRHQLYYRKKVTTKATLSEDGIIDTECSVCGYLFEREIVAKIKSVKMTSKYTYSGKKKTPTVTVKDDDGYLLEKNTDYKVSYADGRKNVGKYKVTVTFKGNYSGKKVLYFEINPKGTKISKLTPSNTSIKVEFEKKTSQVDGYKIEYSTSKKFTKSTTKTKTVKGYKNTSTTLKGLKAGKKYYVRVRTYKTVGGKKYYSSWSKASSKTIKKITVSKSSVKKVSAQKKSLKVTLSKNKKVSGYQIEYSTSKKFSSSKTKTIKGYKNVSATLKSLKAKKTYYVRVRSYKSVDGGKYYSSWSKAVKKKTK